jgi:hypothetical protein
MEGIQEEVKFLRSFSVNYVKRELNMAVHALVKTAYIQVRDSIWLKEVFSLLSDIVCKKTVAFTF